jgi:hypothetical protein
MKPVDASRCAARDATVRFDLRPTRVPTRPVVDPRELRLLGPRMADNARVVLRCQWVRSGDGRLRLAWQPASPTKSAAGGDCPAVAQHSTITNYGGSIVKADTENLMARFSEALRPLGMPDPPSLAREEGPRRLSASHLNELACAAVRFTTAGLATVVIHLAALKCIFWLG